ncbi:sulfotransferase domain-containing protein [Aquibaculum sediminis]|uniref:sulfotransferase domain-containing protein n=1 Tax=Aquibaculum sediminis TaxID=3231907 RepID=UPI003454C852
MTELVVHIGLPKTATTFLQRKVLRKNPSVRMFHKKNSPELIKKAQSFLRKGSGDISDLGRYLDGDRVNVLTNENISLTDMSFWSNRGACTPAILANNLRRLSNLLFGRPDAVRAILSIRRQDRWVASRYAQSASKFAEPGQQDFERRVQKAITRHFSTRGVWIDYAHVIETLEKACPNGVLVLMQEELEHDPVAWARKLDAFLGTKESLEVVEKETSKGTEKYSLSVNEDTWKLKLESSVYITLHDKIKNSILREYAGSNKKLMSRDLVFDHYY